ncbi:MAG TPA: hypothetical protein H9839_09665, partial [Candidatus Intestinimonas stercorigallinarum]|nr:hypothetical protein [Candidatus Intestinimonas stercorigallinarum]
PHFRVQSGTFSMKSKKSAACRKSQSGLFLQAVLKQPQSGLFRHCCNAYFHRRVQTRQWKAQGFWAKRRK